jgi:hypothetical protein
VPDCILEGHCRCVCAIQMGEQRIEARVHVLFTHIDGLHRRLAMHLTNCSDQPRWRPNVERLPPWEAFIVWLPSRRTAAWLSLQATHSQQLQS